MTALKDLLKVVDAQHGTRLELMSGRRPRLVRNGEVKNLADEILTDDEVIDFCRDAGGGRKLDDLSERPVTFVHHAPSGGFDVSVQLRGREVFASFTAHAREGARREPTSPPHAHTMTKRGLKTSRKPTREMAIDARAEREPTHRPGPDVRHRSSQPAKPREAQRGGHEPPKHPARAPEPHAMRHAEPHAARAPEPHAARHAERKTGRTDHPREEPRARRATPAGPAAHPAGPGPAARPLDPQAIRRAAIDPSLRETGPSPDIGVPWEQAPRALRTAALQAAGAHPEPARYPATAPTGPSPHGPAPTRGDITVVLEWVRKGHRLGATDLHIASGATPFARTPRGLVAIEGPRLQAQEVERAMRALLPPGMEDRLARDGGASFARTLEPTTRVRVNATITLEGPKLALRLLDATPPSPEDLSIPEELLRAVDQPQGLCVITGPTGHGKTTTVAALVDHINERRAAHIIMVEDPIEIPIASKKSIVSQRELGTHAASFERALKGALRQDPDVIVIGELRDVETVRIALTASETGHLVLGTMNTPSTKSVIDRLIDLFPIGDQPQVRHTLAGGLKLISNQRLLPCADGRSRVAAFEVVPGSMALWNLIREDKLYQIPNLLQRGRGANIVRLADSIAPLLEAGRVSRDDLKGLLDSDVDLDRPSERTRDEAPETPRVQPPDEGGLGALLSKAGAIFGRRGGA